MTKMIVELEWDEAHGEKWMNIDNLHLLLYGPDNTRPDLLKVKDITKEHLGVDNTKKAAS